MGKVSKECQELIDKAVAQGWTVKDVTNGKMLYPTDKRLSPVTVHGTQSDRRALRNFRAELKRRGFTDDEGKDAT